MTRYTQSDQGQRRSRNEDFALSFKLDDLFGIVVADGLGGHVASHIASELAATTFADAVQRLNDGTLDQDFMTLAFEQAETAVQSRISADSDQYGDM
jgi:protein phosphatase